MTDMQKAAEIKKLQMEIDKRCYFFALLTAIKGSNTTTKKSKK